MATYFLGATSGKSKETGNSWYKVVLLLLDRYGIWKSKEYFVPAKLFGLVINKYKLGAGSAVLPVFDGSGDKPGLKRLLPDTASDSIVLVPDDEDDLEDD